MKIEELVKVIQESRELRDKLDIKIYVDTEDDIRILRRIQRDIKERGRTVDSVIEQYLSTVKQKLLSIITKMDSYYWLFTKHPKTDFSRKKKWSFEEVMKFMLTMEGKALRDELLEYFEFDNTTPSNSSFNQRRAQILPEAFEFLFQEFTKSFTDKCRGSRSPSERCMADT